MSTRISRRVGDPAVSINAKSNATKSDNTLPALENSYERTATLG